MAEPIITSDERQQLIKLYQEDKLNPPPANIKDETLIKNYGTDEQKARLQQPPAAETQKAAENKTNTNADKPSTDGAEAGNGFAADLNEMNDLRLRYMILYGVDPDKNLNSKDIAEANAQKEPEYKHQAGLYKQLYGKDPEKGIRLPELVALNATMQEAGAAQPPATANTGDNKEYINEFTKYVDLHLKMPDSTLTLEELKAANAARVEQIQQEEAEAQQILKNMKAGRGVGGQTVELIHRDTKEKIIMPAYTYDNFMKKQMPEWSLAPEVPAEVKPPVESIGK